MAITTELPTEFVYTTLAMASWVANQIRTSVGCGFRRSVRDHSYITSALKGGEGGRPNAYFC